MATAKGKKAAAANKAAKKPAARKSPAAKAGAAAVSRKPASKKVSLKTNSGSVKPPVKAKATSGKKSPAKKAPAAKGGTSAKGKSSTVSVSTPASPKNSVAKSKTDGLKPSKPVAAKVSTKVSDSITGNKKKANTSKSGKSAPAVKNAPVKPSPVKSRANVPQVNSKPAAKTSKRPAPVKETGSKPAGEPLDPLIVKAEKAIREMEETMDLSKMRPRLQAGSPAIQRHLSSRNHQPPPKLPEPVNTNKVKFQLEFEFRSSPKILFTSLSDSSGLAGWFADEVQTQDDIFTFVWEGGESKARLVALRDLQLVRFQWLDDTDGTYFQFEIKEDDITSDIALVITDFANPGEKDTNIRLWESQVQNLRMLLGSL